MSPSTKYVGFVHCLHVRCERRVEQRCWVNPNSLSKSSERFPVGQGSVISPVGFEHNVGELVNIQALSTSGDQHAIGQRRVAIVVCRPAVHNGGILAFRPARYIALEKIKAVAVKPLFGGGRSGAIQSLVKVIGFVNDAPPGGLGDFHEPRRAQVGERGMG